VSYLVLGAVTVSLGLVASYLYQGKILDSILPLLASHYLTPVCTTIFMLAVVSAVLSTIDSAILAPATVLAQNLVGKIPQTRISAITLNRLSIFFIGFATYLLAISGKGAYSLLEGAYSLTMVGLFVPLTMGLFSKIKGEAAALAAMATGVSIYFCHEVLSWHFFLEPVEAVGALKLSPSLTATACAFLIFVIVGKLCRPAEAS
ncbi:MAG: sodium:solute symporter, partial [Cyanobacteria bacterium HKST-UBA01]|nr:sodium:solute symporter [Cyanobacteria bacterium HKST-UBA01]